MNNKIDKMTKEVMYALNSLIANSAEFESKHPRDEKGQFTNKTKVFTEENYNDFHKLYYENNDNAILIHKEKGNEYYVDEKISDIYHKVGRRKFENLDFNKDVIRFKLPNRLKNNEFKEDLKTLNKFEEKGYNVVAKYNDGYNTNYLLEKEKKQEANKENILEKIKNVKLEKYKPTTYTIDWGKQKRQGKRIGKMIVGSMGDISLQGKKEYTDILGSFDKEEQAEARQYFNKTHEQYLYAQAREYGLNKDDAIDFVISVYG